MAIGSRDSAEQEEDCEVRTGVTAWWHRAAASALLGMVLGAACSSSSPSAAPTTARSATSAAGATTTGAPQIERVVPGDIPDTQAYVPFRAASDHYQVSIPEGWARTEGAHSVTFSDHYNTVRIDVTAAPAAPTTASVIATQLPVLRRTTLGYEPRQVSQVKRRAGYAIRITYRAASAPNAVTGKSALLDVERYEFWSAGRLATLTLSGATGSDNVDPWRKVTDSFAWI